MTAVLYARVSTDDKGQTTESQIREMKRWCEVEGVVPVKIFQEDISGGSLDRPQFDSMMGYIMRKRVGMILALDAQRLSRSTDDMTWINKQVKEFGVIVRFVSSSCEPETLGGKVENFIDTLGGEETRRKIKTNTKIGMLGRSLAGVHCGRPLAIVLEHRVEENLARIKTDGKKPTKIVSVSTITDLANAGYSTAKAADMIGVGRASLERVLKDEGILQSYHCVSAANRYCSKGVTPKRVDSLYPEGGKSGSAEDAHKGSLLGSNETLLGKEGDTQ